MATLRSLTRSMRPNYWVKNLLVFSPLFFANSYRVETLLPAIEIFVVFCLASRGSYILNDIFDRKQDLFHPFKKRRPVASRKLSLSSAILFSLLLQAVSALLAFHVSIESALVTLAFLAVQSLYTVLLQKFTLTDVIFIAIGYLLRTAAGVVASGVTVSPWFLLCVGFLALYLGFVKRRLELTGSYSLSSGTLNILSHYSLEFLTLIERTCLACILVIYVLWTVLGSHSPWMMATIPFVFYGLFKHQALTLRDNPAAGSPEIVWLKDRALLISLLLWLAGCFVVLQI